MWPGYECLFIRLKYQTLIGQAGKIAINYRRLFTKRYWETSRIELHEEQNLH